MKLSATELEKVNSLIAAGRAVVKFGPGSESDPTGFVTSSLPDGISEADFQQKVIAYAELRGWEWHHQHISKRSKEGWPDLILIRESQRRLVVAELKVPPNKASKAQMHWLKILRSVGAEDFIWYPHDWQKIIEVLK